jgi:hypothetical protein
MSSILDSQAKVPLKSKFDRSHCRCSCDPKFAKLKDLLGVNVASNEELGASICVNMVGKNVVDIWAGHMDYLVEAKEP